MTEPISEHMMPPKKPVLIVLFAFLLALALVSGAAAQEGQPGAPSDDAVNAVAKGLYCPVCENIPLDVCPTQACAEWRELIRLKLAAGWTEGQVRDYFAEQYGDRVLSAPPARGLNWLVYLVPPLAFIAGVIILLLALISWRKHTVQPEIPSLSELAEDDEYAARLEDELKKR